jgi:alpha-N-arabinofuranosidase
MTHTLPSSSDFNPVYYVAGKNEDAGSFIWKGAVYNTTDHEPASVSVSFEGVEAGTEASLTVLTNIDGDPYAFNDPFGENIVDSSTVVLSADDDGAFTFELPELSVAVLDTNVENSGTTKRRDRD